MSGIFTVAEGVANYERLKAFAAATLAADPVMARKHARYVKALDARQKRRLSRVLANPDSQEYKDYIIPSSIPDLQPA